MSRICYTRILQFINAPNIYNPHLSGYSYHKLFRRSFGATQISNIRRARREHPQAFVQSEENSEYFSGSPKNLLNDAVTFKEMTDDPNDKWLSNPYDDVSQSQKKRLQESKLIVPDVDKRETSVILFPGQATQYVGMAKSLLDYPGVREMYDASSQILGYDLAKLSCEGPASTLAETKYQQPAIFVASLAALEKLRHDNPSAIESCIASAGFSIGEITALTFSGAFSFEDGLNLVKIRGEAMQIASDLRSSGMITVFFGPDSKLGFACSVAKKYCEKNGIEDADCRVASYLFPHCKVIAGNEEALDFIIKNRDDFRLKKIKRLNVSGAFHTDLMRPAAEIVKEAVQNILISKPFVPVYSNVNACPYRSPDDIRKILPKQIFRPVKWEQILHTLYETSHGKSFPTTYECGPGKSLKAILKMVNAKAWNYCHNISA